jgi:acetate---CoA ligase (ADP-forming)
MPDMGDLSRLLAPRSIAVIGGAPAERVVRQCDLLGFEGDIWPVHPKRAEISGHPTVPSIADLPGVPDAVFVGVNRNATIEAMAQLNGLGIGGAICYASGFAEVGHEGTSLQLQLLDAAGDTPFFGPNCYGYVNTFDGIALWPDEHGCARHEQGVGIISQSGNVGVNLTFQQRGLRLGYMITVGNQANLGTEDALDAMLADERVTTIGMFIEAVRDPQRFAASAIAAAGRGVPIVALKTARSAAGAEIAASHTASLAGRHAAYQAMFDRYGIISVDTPTELIETLKLLDAGGPIRGRSLVSLSCSGGEASLVADRTEHTMLSFEPFSPEHTARIAATVTEHVSISNPFDYHTFMWGDRTAMAECFTQVMDGPQAATMLILDSPPSADNDAASWIVAADALGDAAERTGNRAVVVATMSECLNHELRAAISARGIAPLQGLAEGLAAITGAVWLGEHTGSGVAHSPVTEPGLTTTLDEATAKSRLRDFGVSVPAGLMVGQPADAVTAADQIGYPVTLKVLGLAHKSEHGAVAVGLRNRNELTAALARMPTTDVGYLVEQTVQGIVGEVLVTIRRDPPVGWLITIGSGGVMTELLDDVVHLLAPVTEAEVVAAIKRLKFSALLTGFRGRPPADLQAISTLVVRLADAVVGTNIVEVELNPVLARANGAVAVDALWTEELS